MKSMTEDNW